MSQNYVYKTSQYNEINITTFGNDNLENKNCLIFTHGFKGFKDWGFGPYLASYFAEKGFFVITFNFSHNGVRGNPLEFTELDKFAENTYSLEVNELTEIILAYRNGFFGTVSKESKLGVIGHSRGGGVSIVATSLSKHVDALVTWAAIAKFDRYSGRQKSEWKKKGYSEALNSRTNQMMRHNMALLNDVEQNANGFLNLEKALQNINIPHLVIHGTEDLAVKIEEGEQIYDWSKKENTELLKIYGTGHTFDIKHPFDGSSKAFDKVLEKTHHFFYKKFKES
ncbi:MAG: prolyl oligopeptidase family serine peptidase [Melioribacteraceae bacterium]